MNSYLWPNLNSMAKLNSTFFILLVSLVTFRADAQITTGDLSGNTLNTITTAVPLLMIGPDARAGALGDAGAALSPDANATHWAPAKLASIEGNSGVALSYIPWLRNLVPDINLAYLTWYSKLKNKQAIGGSLRYFSLGNIVFTDIVGTNIGQFNPNEFAIDLAYSRRFGERWSGGLALRYIYSNLTSGIDVQGTPSFPGQAVAADISAYYSNPDLKLGSKKSTYSFAVNISNLGNKISYTQTADRNFLPMNLRLGNMLRMKLDEYNSIAFVVDFNKLLVPTPPVRDIGNQNVIVAGMENNVPIVQGIMQSFYDAPGVLRGDGTRNVFLEELREINPAGGVEYNYNNVFAIRGGYFHEHFTKGNRRYFTLGAGIKFNVFTLDLAYLIPTQQRHPLERTLRFTLQFDFGAFQEQNKQ